MLRPLKDRVIIETTESDGISKGGIVLPDSAKERVSTGVVVYVGPETTVDVGDKVYFAHFAGNDISIDGKTLKVLRESDIFAAETTVEPDSPQAHHDEMVRISKLDPSERFAPSKDTIDAAKRYVARRTGRIK